MKKVLFLLVSALLGGTSYAANLSKDVIAKVTNSSAVSIKGQQEQYLILEQPVDVQVRANAHYSHSSHSSHRSHYSHRSHSSHYSSGF